ncbi:MAG TPA: hypothetical protein VJG32_21870 [Anaerolineae bacterium]|nr:hypothetical protein [Anaerolineae bacterium]
MSISPKLSRLIKPTLDTPFHIDYEWWRREGRDLRAYLLSQIPAEVRDAYAELDDDALVDSVDPETGEVKQEDGLLLRVRSIAKQQADFVNDRTSIIDAVFRTFLINNNQPLTAYDLSRHLNRDATLILRTLAGSQVYKGLRPVVEKN